MNIIYNRQGLLNVIKSLHIHLVIKRFKMEKEKINYALKEYSKSLAWGFHRMERCDCPSGNGPLSLYIGEDDKFYLGCPYNDENGNNGCDYRKEFIPEQWVVGIERERASKQIGDVWDD